MEGILRKLKGLLELSKDTRAPEGERESASSLYLKLVDKYKIDSTSLEEEVNYYEVRLKNSYERALISRIAESHNLCTYRRRRTSHLLYLVKARKSVFDLVYMEYEHYSRSLGQVLEGVTMRFVDSQLPTSGPDEVESDSEYDVDKFMKDNKEVIDAYNSSCWLDDKDYKNKDRLGGGVSNE